jgi:hypothetical protein
MDRVQIKVPWPELTLIACGLVLILVVMFKSSTDTCHRWKQQLREVSGAFLGAAGAEEHPNPNLQRGVEDERIALSKAARQVLDQRPSLCI